MQPYKVWLFSDLIEKNKRDHKHFTGTIVYIVGLDGSTLNEVLIIDGQQRLTTVYILLKALYDAAKGVSVRIEAEVEEVMFNRFFNTRPEGFLFIGEYTKVSSWVDLLTKFINLAYDLNTEVFSDLAAADYSLPNADKTYISNDERKLRRAKQINNSGIFFETNLSSNNIISFIKNLLMGHSSVKRYRAKELHFNDSNIYISTQFFESDRKNVIEWYKEHLICSLYT